MNSRSKILGGIVKRISDLRIHHFEDRLILQKQIYLLQVFGLYLGYRFSWYLHGPYSPDLTKDAYELVNHIDSIEPAYFPTKEGESKFLEYLEFLGNKKDNPKWLEITASIHFLKKVYPADSDEVLFERIRVKDPHLNLSDLKKSLEELEKVKLI